MKTWTRKAFLHASIAGGGAALFAQSAGTAAFAAAGSANGDIRVAVVGLNGKGAQHVEAFRKIPGVRVAALCDVDSEVLARHRQKFDARGEKVATYIDYRLLLEDSSIDAVIIVTPNHWHALMAIWGCQAGKDVYLEKPTSHTVWEGRKVIEAAQKYNRIVAAGTQSRSDPALQEAFAYLQAGHLGKIQWAHGLCYKSRENIGRTSGPQRVPSSIAYDLWCGPAPLSAPRRNTPKWGSVHYDWHWFWNYGGGDIANQGIHEMDMCRWALGERGLPPTVMSIGGRFGHADDAETPNTQLAVFGYAAAPLIFEVRGLPRKTGEKAMDAHRGIRVGLTVQCEHGYFAGGAGGGGLYDKNGAKIKQFSSAGGGGHQANFIAAVRSRNAALLNAPIVEGHLTSTLSNMANISYRIGKDIAKPAIGEAMDAHQATKDSLTSITEHLESNGVKTSEVPFVVGPRLDVIRETEAFATDEKYDIGYWANTLLTREYRHPFVVPVKV